MERSYLRPKQRRQLLTLLKALVDSDAIMPEDKPPILVQLLPSPRVPVVALPLLPRLQALGDDDFASKFRCCEATTACQHTSPLRHLWLNLVTLRVSSSQRHQRLPVRLPELASADHKHPGEQL